MSEFGQVVSAETLDEVFDTGPGREIVRATLAQMAAVTGQDPKKHPFQQIFGPYKPGNQSQRWADYNRADWSLRSLPAIAVYEGETEGKSAPNAWLTGSISITVIWPPSQRRSDWSRVGSAFKGAIENFFESHWAKDMLDEHFSVARENKVPGLNRYGWEISWTPNVEGIVEGQMVPVTLLGVKYRMDLRAWYRALEFDGRTKAQPFAKTLAPLTRIAGEYDGNTPEGPNPHVEIPDSFPVSSP